MYPGGKTDLYPGGRKNRELKILVEGRGWRRGSRKMRIERFSLRETVDEDGVRTRKTRSRLSLRYTQVEVNFISFLTSFFFV